MPLPGPLGLRSDQKKKLERENKYERYFQNLPPTAVYRWKVVQTTQNQNTLAYMTNFKLKI